MHLVKYFPYHLISKIVYFSSKKIAEYTAQRLNKNKIFSM